MNPRSYLTYCFVALLMLGLTSATFAQGPAATAVTTADENIEPAKLERILKPLTLTDLEVELVGPGSWGQKLKDAATAYENVKIGAAEGDADELSKRRDNLADRLAVVLMAFEKKGGDETKVKEWRTYIDINSHGIGGDDQDALQIGQRLYAWLISPEGGIEWGKNLAFFILILIGFKILAAILGSLVKKAVGRVKSLSTLLQDFFVTMTKKAVFVIGVIVALNVLGFEMGAFVAAIGAVGFIVAFALQGTLSNFAAGLMILIYRPFDVGDVVDIAGKLGKVDTMSLVSTTLKTPDNQVVIVPNNSIWGDVITNVTHEDTRRVDLVFGIGYSDDMDQAKTAMVAILEGHEQVLSDPAPVVEVHELADSSVNFVCRPWCRTSDYWKVYWDITKTVKEKFDAEGISIPFPQQDVHMHTVDAAD